MEDLRETHSLRLGVSGDLLEGADIAKRAEGRTAPGRQFADDPAFRPQGFRQAAAGFLDPLGRSWDRVQPGVHLAEEGLARGVLAGPVFGQDDMHLETEGLAGGCGIPAEARGVRGHEGVDPLAKRVSDEEIQFPDLVSPESKPDQVVAKDVDLALQHGREAGEAVDRGRNGHQACLWMGGQRHGNGVRAQLHPTLLCVVGPSSTWRSSILVHGKPDPPGQSARNTSRNEPAARNPLLMTHMQFWKFASTERGDQSTRER